MDSETDHKPFEVVEEDGWTILRLHGTEGERAKVEADKVHIIMEAIAQGWDIDIEYADIEGDLDIWTIAEKLERAESGKLLIKGNIRMDWCDISGYASFVSAHFTGYADFESAHFTGYADFGAAHFSEYAHF